jgi:hypothetical protein
LARNLARARPGRQCGGAARLQRADGAAPIAESSRAAREARDTGSPGPGALAREGRSEKETVSVAADASCGRRQGRDDGRGEALGRGSSIGIPVYNGEAFLRQTLESILAQSFTPFELIVSDNASTDGTAEEIARAFASRDSRVRYHRNP